MKNYSVHIELCCEDADHAKRLAWKLAELGEGTPVSVAEEIDKDDPRFMNKFGTYSEYVNGDRQWMLVWKG